MTSTADAQPVAAVPRRDPQAGDGWLTVPPVTSRTAVATGIDSLLLRIGASVRAAQVGALVYEERGQRLRARRARRVGTRLARAMVRETLAAGGGDLAARPPEPEPEQLALDLTAAAASPVEARAVSTRAELPLDGDTVEVPVVTVPDSAPAAGLVRLPPLDPDRDESRAVRLPFPEAEPVEIARIRLPAPEPEGTEPAPEAPGGVVVELDTGLLDRISAYTRVPAAVP